MLKLDVNIKLIDREPLDTFVEEVKAVKHILTKELGNYNFIITDISVEEDHS